MQVRSFWGINLSTRFFSERHAQFICVFSCLLGSILDETLYCHIPNYQEWRCHLLKNCDTVKLHKKQNGSSSCYFKSILTQQSCTITKQQCWLLVKATMTLQSCIRRKQQLQLLLKGLVMTTSYSTHDRYTEQLLPLLTKLQKWITLYFILYEVHSMQLAAAGSHENLYMSDGLDFSSWIMAELSSIHFLSNITVVRKNASRYHDHIFSS